jgi:hypothetical protein
MIVATLSASDLSALVFLAPIGLSIMLFFALVLAPLKLYTIATELRKMRELMEREEMHRAMDHERVPVLDI